MQLPLEGSWPRLRPSFAAALIATVVVFVLLVWPLLRGGPELALPQGGARSLRNPDAPLLAIEADRTPVTAPEAPASPTGPPPLDVGFDFVTPYADSVVLANLDTICDTPAPEGAIHVAVDGDDDNPGTFEQPMATITRAVSRAEAGQTVLVRGGEYRQTVLVKEKYGTPEAWITIRSYPGERATLIGDIGENTVYFRKGNAYVNVACFEMAGPTERPDAVPSSPDLNRNRALSGANAITNPINYGAGVDIGDRADTRAGFPLNHHIRIIANEIHDYAEAGIGVVEANHVSAIGNRIYGNAKYSCHAGSGITFGYMLDAGGPDNADGYSNYIVGNVAYDNENRALQCFSDNLGAILTDGNGIIIDQTDLAGDAYTARTLIADNVVYGNGGRGILVFESSRVDVVNNLSYQNVLTDGLMGRDGPHPEIAVAKASDVRIYNNIAIPRQGHVPYLNNDADVDSLSNIFGEPGDERYLFEAPAIDGSGDFSLRSSAVNVMEAGIPYLASPGPSGLPTLVAPVAIGPLYNDG